jgi:peptide/nickel transport system substrate-binding protein
MPSALQQGEYNEDYGRQGRPEAFGSRGLPVDGRHSAGGQEVERIEGPRGSAGSQRVARAAAGGSARWRLFPLGLWAAAALSAPACSTTARPPAPPAPVTLTIGLPQVSQIDPNRGLGMIADVIANEGMTASDADGRARPLLLDHWSTSPDGLVWRLTMRGGVKFHDGSAVTAADLVRAIEEGRKDANGMGACLRDIAGVTAVGAVDVDVTLTRRCYFLLDDLMTAVTRPSGDGTAEVGTGPFSVASLSADELVLDANRNYHLGRPAADRVVARSYDTLRTAWAEMMRGRLDFLPEVGPDSAEFLADQSSIDLRTYVSTYANMLLLNNARPLFRSPAIRRALNFAVDRLALVQQGQKGHGVPATVPTWPNHWARGEAGGGFTYDPERAAALLAGEHPATGRPGAAAGSPLLEFTCLIPARFAIIERLSLLVQRQLAEVGVRMRVESIPAEALSRRLGAGDFDALLLPFLSGPYAWVPFRTWHSPGASKRWNFWGYRSAAVDAAIDAMRDARDDAEFVRALRRFEAAFENDPPAVLLTWNETIQAVSHRFVVPREADGRDAMHFISRWSLRPPGHDQP